MNLIDRIRADVQYQVAHLAEEWRDYPAVHPVATYALIAEAESRLGFLLPPLLRAIYLQIGNGGLCIGPHLMGIFTSRIYYKTDDAIEHYFQGYDGTDPRQWIRGMFPLADKGCCAFLYVDCLTPPFPVYLHDIDRIPDEANPPKNDDEADQRYETMMNDYRDALARRDFSHPVWLRQADSFEEWCESWLPKPR